ncbi:hypothetical protein BDQ12DRAFT_634344 [Crucibulum laeve]|uniref:Acetyl-CoA synthetase-like protein n=1 Tax=Crucibulum laeve TaxID=68775 RepID=A0A5C3LSV7_9AGAR|nr:hypothetical protein BDQ12DRAFT_634344 [Crucibulum laeve]
MGSIQHYLSALPSGPDLLPNVIDHRSYNDAGRVCISYPLPGTSDYVDITYGDFGHAVDQQAWSFDKAIGARKSSSDPTKIVGILARSDAAYMISIYALHKCGITPMLISPRNSRAAIVNLLKLTSAVGIISDHYNKDEATASAAEVGSIAVIGIAPLPTPNPSAARKPFPFKLTWEEECDKPIIILHTSGSTGLPKPVAWSSRFVWHQGFYPPKFVSKYEGSTVLATLPLFHGSGVALTRASLLWLGWKVVFPDPTKPVSATALVEFCQSRQAPDIVIGAPSVIEDIATLEGGLDVMRRRAFWFFVGAPVPPHFGDLLVREKIHFLSMLGSTEIGQMNVLEPEGRAPEDWNYHEIRPDLDIVLEPRGPEPNSGPYELIILAKDGWRPGTINVNINSVEGYSTSDLYQRHHSHPRLLKHCGRADDVIVLSNGEKTLSRAIEIPIEADPHVNAAVVFGTGRTQNGVLIAPAPGFTFDPTDEEALATFRNTIWPSVEKANANSPSHSQIWKEMLLITSPGKDLPRTDKGSVRRKNALQLYAEEIDNLYLAVESLSSKNIVALPAELTADELTPFFEQLIEEAMGRPLAADDDVFGAGMDSLKAIFVRNSLLSALRSDERTANLVSQVPQNFVFQFTSSHAMASAIAAVTQTGHFGALEQESEKQHADEIEAMVRKYTANFPAQIPASKRISGTSSGEAVILTGSTGSLGSFTLHVLLADPRVNRVICFNRRGLSSDLTRQERSFEERKLDTSVLHKSIADGRLVFHSVEINLPSFGLPLDVYNDIHASATLFIHNAWALNFNWSLSTFESVHIQGLRNVVDFALTSPQANLPRVAFTSSIASAGAFTTGPVPETPLWDPSFCLAQGYARSKFVGERILAIASEQTGLKTAAFRIGQISGDNEHGIWNATDNVPVLLRGCQEIAAIPNDWVPVVSWIPVDDVARTLADVVLDQERGTGTFHIANPQATPWASLVPGLQRLLITSDGREFETVPMAEWIQRLKDCDQSPDDNPAIKLIAFFETILAGKGIRCRLSVEKTSQVSPALSSVTPVDEDKFAMFIQYWKGLGFLRSSA